MIRIDLSYPAKALWPNGRAHHLTKAREVRKHRCWADLATAAAIGRETTRFNPEAPIPVRIIVHPKATGPLPDRDNAVNAAKAFLDGIADRLGVNDRQFAAPTVEFATPRNSRFIIEIGE